MAMRRNRVNSHGPTELWSQKFTSGILHQERTLPLIVGKFEWEHGPVPIQFTP